MSRGNVRVGHGSESLRRCQPRAQEEGAATGKKVKIALVEFILINWFKYEYGMNECDVLDEQRLGGAARCCCKRLGEGVGLGETHTAEYRVLARLEVDRGRRSGLGAGEHWATKRWRLYSRSSLRLKSIKSRK